MKIIGAANWSFDKANLKIYWLRNSLNYRWCKVIKTSCSHACWRALQLSLPLLMNDKWKVLQSCVSQSTQSRMAQRIASQKRMLSSVIVTFRITLTIKRSIRKPAMTETTVTTCGVTIFEVSQMTPITTESRIVSSMKRVQPKWRTCLGEVGCCLFLSVLFDTSALMKAGVWTSWFMMIVFISELLIVQEQLQDTLPHKAKCL